MIFIFLTLLLAFAGAFTVVGGVALVVSLANPSTPVVPVFRMPALRVPTLRVEVSW